MKPNKHEHNDDLISNFFDYNLHLQTRTIYSGSQSYFNDDESGTDFQMADNLIKCLHILDQTPGDITIIHNNSGGDWYHCLAIYDAIKLCQNNTIIKVFGYGMSSGSVILQAADVRLVAPNARIMIHYGEGGGSGHSLDAVKWGEEHKKQMTLLEDLYLEQIKKKHPRFTRRKIQDLLRSDHIMTAQETVDLGLADDIIHK